MIVSYNWLQEYFNDELPEPSKLAEELTMYSFEVESVEEKNGDYVLDIDILPNRAHDCLSHIGIAREVGIVSGLALKESFREPLKAKKSEILEVLVENDRDCPRYMGLVVKGVENGESPDWLKERLAAIGQKPINKIVDATNYVMFETGQPLHAFDVDKLSEKNGKFGIGVRRAKEKEKIALLTGENLILDGNNLVITDLYADEPLGIAGIKGGKKAEIDAETLNIVIEAAKFNPVLTRKSAKAAKIQTDASKRFENEIAPEIAPVALKRVSELIGKIAGGETEGVVDIFPKPALPYKVGVSTEEINKVLGTNLKEKEVDEIFDRLGFSWKKVNTIDVVIKMAESLLGKPYKFGASVLRDSPDCFDCSSLVCYLYGNGGVFVPRISVDQYLYGEEIRKEDLKAGDLIFLNSDESEARYHGIEFMPNEEVAEGVSHVGIYIGDGKVLNASGKIGKVVMEDMENSRFSKAVGYRRIADDKERYVVEIPFERLDLRIKEDLIEEVGRIYGYEKVESKLPAKPEKKPEINKTFYYANKIRRVLTGLGFSEIQTSSFGRAGEVAILNPLAEDKAFLRRDLSGNMKEAADSNLYFRELLGLDDVKMFEIGKVFGKNGEELHLAICHTGGGSSLEESIAVLSKVLGGRPAFERVSDFVAEAGLGEFLEKLPEAGEYDMDFDYSRKQFRNFSQYPFVLRDIAVFLPEGKDEKDLLKTIEAGAGRLLASSRLVDVYEKKFPEGGTKTSYAFRLVFQSEEKTLSDEEANGIMSKIGEEISKESGWEIR